MHAENKEKIISIIAVVIIIIFGAYLFFQNSKNNEPEELDSTVQTNSPIQENKTMKIEILQNGEGKEAQNGNAVSVHYVGTLENGTKFDSSIDRGIPFSFILGSGQVIRGWDIGILGMKLGEKRKLIIPPDLAYGKTGTPGGPIPPEATLVFEVELLQIN